MPNQEDENKPKVETPKAPETPEQAAARAADAVQAGKEKSAAVTLAGAESEEVVDVTKEKKKLQDLGYLHVEDMSFVEEAVAKELGEKLGMKNKLGWAKSLEGAVAMVKKLAQEGKPLDLILLDRTFPLHEGDDEISEEKGGDRFLMKFEGLIQDPQFKDQLKDTRIIMVTSHADDPEAMQEFRALSSRVIGGISKGSEKLDVDKIKAALIEAGVVEKN